nr:hypothetical protein [Mucilaginibacter sp. L294]
MKIYILFLLVACSLKTIAQNEKIEEGWIKADSIFIEQVTKSYKSNPSNLWLILPDKTDPKTKLGFNYYLIKGSNGKGYVSFFYEFVIYNNQLVSYEIKAQMPSDERLKTRYKKFYSNLINFNKYEYPEPLYYGYDEMIKPLKNITINSSRKDIQFLMTPYSGTRYGVYGGDPITIIPNRALFDKVKKYISPPICRLLLYSKNPATRLYGIEYYYLHPKLFTNKSTFENRIREVFKEMPEVETMSADVILYGNSEKLIRQSINILK